MLSSRERPSHSKHRLHPCRGWLRCKGTCQAGGPPKDDGDGPGCCLHPRDLDNLACNPSNEEAWVGIMTRAHTNTIENIGCAVSWFSTKSPNTIPSPHPWCNKEWRNNCGKWSRGQSYMPVSLHGLGSIIN